MNPHPCPPSRSLPAAALLIAAFGAFLVSTPVRAAPSAVPIAATPLAAGLAPAPAAKPALPATRPASAVPRKPASRNKSRRLSKATLAALQPVSLPAAADAPAAPAALAHLSPIVKQRATANEGGETVPASPLARALDTPISSPARPVSTQVLPAQEEALALARQQAAPEVAASLPEEPGVRARKDVETGPMRLRVRRQAVQMSVEFPFQ